MALCKIGVDILYLEDFDVKEDYEETDVRLWINLARYIKENIKTDITNLRLVVIRVGHDITNLRYLTETLSGFIDAGTLIYIVSHKELDDDHMYELVKLGLDQQVKIFGEEKFKRLIEKEYYYHDYIAEFGGFSTLVLDKLFEKETE